MFVKDIDGYILVITLDFGAFEILDGYENCSTRQLFEGLTFY